MISLKSKIHALHIIGVILIIVQVISFIGLSHGYSLYPKYTPYYHTPVERSELTFGMILVAAQAGFDRFELGISDLIAGDESANYHPGSATQMMSSSIREALGSQEDGSFGLFVYDTILTVFYCVVGIMGFVLMLIGTKIKRKREGTDYKNYPETPYGDIPSDPSAPSWQKFLE